MTSYSDAATRAEQAFSVRYGTAAPIVVRAPGRVNLIGEHTDYNDGFVLPAPLPFETVIAAMPSDDTTVEAVSEGFDSTSFDYTANPMATEGWGRYVHGMGHLLHRAGHPIGGWRGTVATDIPAGAGLSSSAAIEVGSGLLFLTIGQGVDAAASDRSRAEVAATGTRVENEVFGLPSGVMDQLASATAGIGGAVLINCGTNETRPVPLPADTMIVVLDSGTRRELVDSAYADRRESCERAAKLLGVSSLATLSTDDLAAVERRLAAADVLRRRVRHVITENDRTVAAAAALAGDDVEQAGRLMSESHRSLRDDYEVSGPALDAIVEVAMSAPGCLGARMTGGGFAGCAVALVAVTEVDAFCQEVERRYRPPAEQPAVQRPVLYSVRPGHGASIEDRRG